MRYLFYVFGCLTVIAWFCADPSQDARSKNRGEKFLIVMMIADPVLVCFFGTGERIASLAVGIVLAVILLWVCRLFSG